MQEPSPAVRIDPYPVSFAADDRLEGRNRLTTLEDYPPFSFDEAAEPNAIGGN